LSTGLLIIIIISSLIYPINSAQNTSSIVTSSGKIINNKGLKRLHIDGSIIKDEYNNTVILRGICLYETASLYIDRLRLDDDISTRINRLKDLGINYIRLPINKNNWDNNVDTNNDGIGARDFYYQLIEEITNAGIYVFIGLHYGVDSSEETMWSNNQSILIEWYTNNIINRFRDNKGVNIYVWNEPRYHLWGGSDIGGGITSGYWDSMKQICQGLYDANNNILLIVHADMKNRQGLLPALRTDPINLPNIIYTWHYYYNYGPAFNSYDPWMSGIEDPTYEYLRSHNLKFYQSYASGNMTQAKEEFEQSLYDRFLWVQNELNLPIICDEFGFNGDEIPSHAYRACDDCGWYGKITTTVDESNNPNNPPFEGIAYCPICHEELSQPQPYAEPGWPQVMYDFIDILERNHSSWNYFCWWPKTVGGYGATENDMHTLSKTGMVVYDWINMSN
jgi:hypothetical protein